MNGRLICHEELLSYVDYKLYSEGESNTLAFSQTMILLEFKQIGNGLIDLCKLFIYYVDNFFYTKEYN
jgi:hypothetical protein